MSDWTENAVKFENEDELYQEWLDKIGFTKVDHYSMVFFGSPLEESFLKKITINQHIYALGDRLSKIAHDHYGDARLWWVLAWFNGKPTDFHCNIGDRIAIPKPLDQVLYQAYNRLGG
tara:strand:+ start:6145 stop:6498 length:354 start_codon:yes stop_codon:yes gene_type:complete